MTVHVIAILTRGIAEDRVPWGNMYEFIAAFTCMAVLVLVAASVWYRAYYMGLFVLVPIVFGLGVDLTVLYTPAGLAGAGPAVVLDCDPRDRDDRRDRAVHLRRCRHDALPAR